MSLFLAPLYLLLAAHCLCSYFVHLQRPTVYGAAIVVINNNNNIAAAVLLLLLDHGRRISH